MHILIGLGLAVVLLYFWLIGQWFARVLVFLAFGGVFGLFGVGLLNAAAPQLGVLGAIGGGVLAWFVAGIPVYYWRWRIKELAARAEAADERQRRIDIARFYPDMPPAQVHEMARRLTPERKRELLSPPPYNPPPVEVAPKPPPPRHPAQPERPSRVPPTEPPLHASQFTYYNPKQRYADRLYLNVFTVVFFVASTILLVALFGARP